MSDTTDAATEVVAEVADEVAEQATHVAEVSRGLSGRSLSLVLGGFVVGAGLGGAIGYILSKRQLEKKYYQQAADEIAEMREEYHNKAVALENKVDKPKLEDIVRERGYAADPRPTQPPMAVTPPASVVEAQEDGEDRKPESDPVAQNAFEEFGDDNRNPDEWDWHKERSRRSPNRPYVIHIDERDERDTYDGVTWTYFEADDVLCNERDEIVDAEDREKVVGASNLEKFGHGSGDPEVVYIRNDRLEMIIEVSRSLNSYAEEVHGLEPEIRHSNRRRGRIPFDDE